MNTTFFLPTSSPCSGRLRASLIITHHLSVPHCTNLLLLLGCASVEIICKRTISHIWYLYFIYTNVGECSYRAHDDDVFHRHWRWMISRWFLNRFAFGYVSGVRVVLFVCGRHPKHILSQKLCECVRRTLSNSRPPTVNLNNTTKHLFARRIIFHERARYLSRAICEKRAQVVTGHVCEVRHAYVCVAVVLDVCG